MAPKRFLPLIPLLLLLTMMPVRLLAQEPVVQALLFYSPTCPHCHDVIDNVLPPLKAQYGDQLQLVGIDTTKASGQQLYLAAYENFAAPETSQGVPVLLVGDTYLVGAVDIPAQFPAIIEVGLRNGGIPWPAVPGLREAIPNLPPDAGTETAAVSPSAALDSSTILADSLPAEASVTAEPASGFALAWIVLGGMLLALAYVGWRLLASRDTQSETQAQQSRLTGWLIPLLALAGLGVALYLAYIEITHSTCRLWTCGRLQHRTGQPLRGTLRRAHRCLWRTQLSGHPRSLGRTAIFRPAPSTLGRRWTGHSHGRWHHLFHLPYRPGTPCHKCRLRLVPQFRGHHDGSDACCHARRLAPTRRHGRKAVARLEAQRPYLGQHKAGRQPALLVLILAGCSLRSAETLTRSPRAASRRQTSRSTSAQRWCSHPDHPAGLLFPASPLPLRAPPPHPHHSP